jgi:gliding motility-associated protein GldE
VDAATQAVEVDPVTFVLGGAVLLLLLLVSALVSGSEVALFSIDATTREHLATAGDRASRRVIRLLERPRALLVSILILNTVVNVGAAVLAAVLTHRLAAVYGWSEALTFVGEVIALTFVLLVVSEITPKLLASRNAVGFARRVSLPLSIAHRPLFPLSAAIARRMQAFHGRFAASSTRLSGEDVKAMAEIGEAHGSLEEEERELIHSIVEFGETTVREIMISRLDIVAIPAGATLSDAVATIRKSGHSRMPLYVEHLDNILGVVYAKDLLRYMVSHAREEHIDWTRITRPPMFVPLGKKLDDLLRDFQSRKTHIAIVVDEYGGTAGLVTLENVLEEIVGDIRDEHDEFEEALFEKLDDERYRFDARIDLDELNELLGTDIDTEEFDFETLGGLIFHLTGAIPSVGEEVSYGDLHMTVETVLHHRIGRVLLERRPDRDRPVTEQDHSVP